MTKPVTYAKIEDGRVVTQAVSRVPIDGWLPIVVEGADYDTSRFQETGRTDRIEADRVVRVVNVEPIKITAEMVKFECQRRIIAHCGALDITGAIIRQLNDPGLKAGIDSLRAKSNALEAMSPIPADFRNNSYWEIS